MSKIHHIDSENPNAEVINLAATVLRDGGLVVFPTETVYGIGALADSKFGAQEIFEVKVRPLDKPLPWLVENEDALDTYGVEIPEYAHKLAHEYWPGPLSLVVKASDRVGKDFRAPDGTVALRSPDHEVIIELHPGCRWTDHRHQRQHARQRRSGHVRGGRAPHRASRRPLARRRRDRAPAGFDGRDVHRSCACRATGRGHRDRPDSGSRHGLEYRQTESLRAPGRHSRCRALAR